MQIAYIVKSCVRNESAHERAMPSRLKSVSRSFPIRLPESLHERAKIAATRLHMSDQDALRLALAIGLEDLECIDYQLARVVVDAAKGRSGKPKPQK
jgi:predicted DNA-binding protein